jgi:hypothetical protein
VVVGLPGRGAAAEAEGDARRRPWSMSKPAPPLKSASPGPATDTSLPEPASTIRTEDSRYLRPISLMLASSSSPPAPRDVAFTQDDRSFFREYVSHVFFFSKPRKNSFKYVLRIHF